MLVNRECHLGSGFGAADRIASGAERGSGTCRRYSEEYSSSRDRSRFGPALAAAEDVRGDRRTMTDVVAVDRLLLSHHLELDEDDAYRSVAVEGR